MQKINKSNMKLTWIGPLVPDKYISCWAAASPAAMKWQKHIVKSIINEKIHFEWFYYRPERYWPFGMLFPSKKKLSSNFSFKNKQINYLNCPGLRDFTKKFYLKKLLKKKINSNKSQLQILISYNSPKWINDVFLDDEIRKSFATIYIIADRKAGNGADGYVFMSYDYYKKYKTNKLKLHLDGAIYPENLNLKLKKFSKKNKKKIFLYTGSFHKWGGIKMLLDAVKLIKNKNFELWLSGPGFSQVCKSAASKDKRIKYLGLLSASKLKNIYQKADVFLNPRPIKISGNEFNFPSKLFDYLAWNKPIISTWSKAFSPDYKKVLDIAIDDPSFFAKVMEKYLLADKIFKKNNKKWIANKNWKNQCKKLINYLKRVNNKKLKAKQLIINNER